MEKETAVMLKCIEELPRNLAKVHNLIPSFDVNHKILNCSILSIVSIVFYCLSYVLTSMLCQRYKKSTEGQI